MNNISDLWWQKYRPKTLDELILNKESKDILKSFDSSKNIPHLLFTSTAGTGKTSTAKILVNDVLNCDHLYINASEENGIDTIRTKIIGFSQTKSFDGNIKVIILDEADSLTKSAQDALRNIMEEYSDNVRFILTGNYKHKIIEPIQSRCQTISFDNSFKDYYARCVDILIKEGIKVPKEQIQELKKLTKCYYPDFRKSLNEIQKFSSTGTLNIGTISISSEFIDEVYEMVRDDVLECRKFLISSESSFQSDYHALLKSLLNSVYTRDIAQLVKKDAIVIIATHMEKHSMVIDTEINAFCCIIKLSEVLNR